MAITQNSPGNVSRGRGTNKATFGFLSQASPRPTAARPSQQNQQNKPTAIKVQKVKAVPKAAPYPSTIFESREEYEQLMTQAVERIKRGEVKPRKKDLD
jgi:hypothetical protein